MQSNFRLISALMRGVWFIEPGYAEEQLPLIDRLLAGQRIEQNPAAWLRHRFENVHASSIALYLYRHNAI